MPCFLPLLSVVQEQVGEEEEQEKTTQHLTFDRCGYNLPRRRDCDDLVCEALPVSHPQTLRFRMLLASRAPELSTLLSRLIRFSNYSRDDLHFHCDVRFDWTFLIPVQF